MIDILMSCLKANEEISAYEVSTKHTKSVQLFYVLNKLETNRYCENDDLSVFHDASVVTVFSMSRYYKMLSTCSLIFSAF